MFESLLVNKLTLAFGRNAGEPAQDVELCNLTVFVGPNSSGKSLALNEINGFTENIGLARKRIVQDLTFTPLTEEEVDDVLSRFNGLRTRKNSYPQETCSLAAGVGVSKDQRNSSGPLSQTLLRSKEVFNTYMCGM